MIAAAQALDIRGIQPSPVISAVLSCIREKIPHLDDDRPLFTDNDVMKELLLSGKLVELVSEMLPKYN